MSEELMPDKNGRFGIYGGRYVAETLVPALEELSDQYELIKKDNKFYGNIFKGKYLDCGTLNGYINSGIQIFKGK